MWSYQQHVQISLQPTMIGVNLGYHMPAEVSQTVQEKLKNFIQNRLLELNKH